MRAVIQRVTHASVNVGNETVGSIGKGMLLLLGVGEGDTEDDLKYIAKKSVELRFFEDENEKMNKSVIDINGEMLIISQFTLYGDCRKGRRPSFDEAMEPRAAEELYEKFIDLVGSFGVKTAHGIFGADMKVTLLNDGPVTLLLDSKKII